MGHATWSATAGAADLAQYRLSWPDAGGGRCGMWRDCATFAPSTAIPGHLQASPP